MLTLISPDVSWPVLISGWGFLAAMWSAVQSLLLSLVCIPWVLMMPLWAFSVLCIIVPSRTYEFLRSSLNDYRHKQRQQRPKEESVWIVHGRRYDLTDFSSKHPGGAWALELGRNRDCTGLFESYHVFVSPQKLKSILAKYEVPDQPEKVDSTNSTGLIFGDPFHEDVKQMARDYFKETGRSWKMKRWVLGVAIATIVAEIIAGIGVLYGSRVAVVIMPLLGSLLVFNVSHDASHFALSSRPFLNNLFTFTSLPLFYNSSAWYIQHIVQHHVYTNDEDDVDLYHFLPVARTSRLSEYIGRYRFQWLLVFLALPTSVTHLLFVVPVDLLSRYTDPVTLTKRYQQCQNVNDIVASCRSSMFLEFAFSLCWLIGSWHANGFLKGFCYIAVSYTIASLTFIAITQGAHLQEQCMIEKEEELSWAKRQVMTAMNFKPESRLWTYVSGGLNMQALHHILPPVSATHLRDMYPRFRVVCEKHGVKLKEADGITDFFLGFYRWIVELSSPDPDRIPTGASEKAKLQ